MPEYLPVHAPGQAVTRTASATVTGGQLLSITGDRRVAPTSGPGAVEGVASHDALVEGLVGVYAGGIQSVTAAGAIAAGARVQSAAAGQVATWAGTNAADIIGHATAGAANGAKVTVRLYNA